MAVLNPNLATLEHTAQALETILPHLVFVGGTIAGLLIDDPGASPARVTRDVDVVAQIAGHPGYLWGTKTMRGLGFSPDRSEGAPACRWVKKNLVVDLMGTEETLFGEANPWYAEGFASRVPYALPETGLEIFVLSAPVFLLTKWAAFQGRGEGSFSASHDIEDLLGVLDGRGNLAEEAAAASAAVKQGLQAMAQGLLQSEEFRSYCLPSLGEREGRVMDLLSGFQC